MQKWASCKSGMQKWGAKVDVTPANHRRGVNDTLTHEYYTRFTVVFPKESEVYCEFILVLYLA